MRWSSLCPKVEKAAAAKFLADETAAAAAAAAECMALSSRDCDIIEVEGVLEDLESTKGPVPASECLLSSGLNAITANANTIYDSMTEEVMPPSIRDPNEG